MGKPTVLVLGAGFAGRAAAARLARSGRVRVRLIDARPASEFNPLWPDVISGQVRPGTTRADVAGLCRSLGIDFLQTPVRRIDPGAQQVLTDAGAYSADFLLCCLGSQTNRFGRRDVCLHALVLNSTDQAMAIRRQALVLMGQSLRHGEGFNLVVVGGGFTGLEVASHLMRLVRRQEALVGAPLGGRVIVVEHGARLLSGLEQRMDVWARQLMGQMGVEVRTGQTLERFEDGPSVCLSDGTVLPRAMVVWATGVMPADPLGEMDLPRTSNRRLAVDATLRVSGYDRFFAAGDVAGAIPPGQEAPLRQGVQFSLAGGRCAADNILADIRHRRPRTFDPVDPGYVVPIAGGVGVGRILRRPRHGRWPYYLHCFMSVVRSRSWRNRFDLLADLARRWS
jgi:NADH dehydrogenase